MTPVFNKCDKKIINNYRPISLLPVISKILEIVIFDQLTDYVTTNNLFSSQQYGFRKNESTELAALELIDRLLTQLHGFKIPINFYMDLSKAFDSLNHNILLHKLTYYGVRNSAITLPRSYLSNRKQYVQIDDVSSSMLLTQVCHKIQLWDLSCLIYLSMIIACLVTNLILSYVTPPGGEGAPKSCQFVF